MSRHRDEVYLLDIRQSCARIAQYSAGVTWEAFAENTEKQDAIIRQLEIIGEATSHLSLAFREAHDKTPWQRIKGLRDVLIHGYGSVDVGRVWTIAVGQVPQLGVAVTHALAEREADRAR